MSRAQPVQTRDVLARQARPRGEAVGELRAEHENHQRKGTHEHPDWGMK